MPSDYVYRPGEFSPRKDLKTIAKWVRSNEKQYMEEYSSENACCIIDRIYYWLCRWGMENTSARVQKVIADLREEVPKRYKKDYEKTVKKKDPDTHEKKRINSGFFRAKDWSFDSSVGTQDRLAVAIHPVDCKDLFPDEKDKGHLYIKIDKKIFTCFEEKKIEQGALGFKNHKEISSNTLNGISWVSPISVDPQNFTAGKIFIKVHLNSSESIFNKKEYKEKLVTHWENNCLQLGATYGLNSSLEELTSSKLDESLSGELDSDETDANHDVKGKPSPVFTVLKMKDGKDGSMHSAFLANDTKVKLFTDQGQFPIFRDEVITNTEEAIFTFKIALNKKSADSRSAVDRLLEGIEGKSTKKMEYKEEEMALKIREEIAEEHLSMNQAIVKDNAHACLTQVKIGDKVYKADDFFHSIAGKDCMSIRKFALHPSSKIVFENGCPDKLCLIPPDIIYEDLSEQKSFAEFLIEEGLIGLPEDIETSLTPILYGRGELSGIMQERGIHASRGMVLYGPPGVGKTTFVMKLAKYLGVPASRVQMISATEVFDKYLGGTEEKIRELFAPANKAYADLGDKSPLYLIAVDEIDALAACQPRSFCSYRSRKA